MEELKHRRGVDFTAGAVLRDFFRMDLSNVLRLFDNVADAMFYGMLTMAEPHAQG